MRARFFTEPLHPYSHKLMASVPRLHERHGAGVHHRPAAQPAQPARPAAALPIAARMRFEKCDEEPPMFDHPDGGPQGEVLALFMNMATQGRRK